MKIQQFLTRDFSPDQHRRFWIWAGHVYFGLMLLLSLVYYRERMLCFDTANYAFQLIVNQGFYTGHGRFLTYATQVLPLLAVKAGLSLKAVLMIYSASFVLFFYSAYLILVYGLRNIRAGIFLALSICLTVRYKFYGPVGEIVLSMALLALLAGWVTRDKERFPMPVWADTLIAMGLAALLLVGHPFIGVSAMVFLGFDLCYRRRWLHPEAWVLIGWTLAAFAFKFKVVQENPYESARSAPLEDIWEVINNWGDYYVTNRVNWFFETEYALPFAVFAALLIWLVFLDRGFTALYTFLSFCGILLLVVVLHVYLDSPIYIMLDGYLAHLGLVWSLPVAFFLLPKRKMAYAGIVAALLLFGLDRMKNRHRYFEKRLDQMEAIFEQHPDNRKLMAHMRDFDWNTWWLPWASGVETLLLTSLDGPEHSATLYFENWGENWDKKIADPKLFLSVQFAPTSVPASRLPKRYFQLPQVPYVRIDLKK